MNRARRVALVTAVCVLGTVTGARPAAAGAGLDDTSPRASAVLEGAPTEIVLDFDDAVEQGFGAVELYDEFGTRLGLDPFVDSGDSTQVVVPVTSPSDLGAGAYVVVYRLVTVDAQPLAGLYSFQIGAGATDQRAARSRVLAAVPTIGVARSVGWAFGAANVLAAGGVVVVLGGWALVGLGRFEPRRRARRTVTGGLVAAVAGAGACFALQGARVLGGGLAEAFALSRWDDLAGTRYGVALVVRLVLLGLAAVPVAGLHLAGRGSWRSSAAAVGAGVLVAAAVAGHSFGGRWPLAGAALSVVHLAGVAVWLGALVVVAAEPSDLGVRTVSRWGDVAIPAVLVSGLLQTWRLLPDATSLSATTYGRTLVAKIAVVVLLVVLATLARSLVRSVAARALRPLLVAEAVLGLGVLAVGAGLVSVSPDLPNTAAPVVAVVEQSGYTASMTVTPGRVGANDVHLTVTQPEGSTEPVAALSLRIGRPDLGLPAVSVALAEEGPDHFAAYSVEFASAGTWQVDLLVTSAAGTTVSLATTVDISGR